MSGEVQGVVRADAVFSAALGRPDAASRVARIARWGREAAASCSEPDLPADLKVAAYEAWEAVERRRRQSRPSAGAAAAAAAAGAFGAAPERRRRQ